MMLWNFLLGEILYIWLIITPTIIIIIIIIKIISSQNQSIIMVFLEHKDCT